jgi:hypothetical protein
MRSLVSGAAHRSHRAVVIALLLTLGLPVRPASAPHLVEDASTTGSAGAAHVPAVTLLVVTNQETLQDPPQRFPPTGGPRIPNPLLPPQRTKPYPTLRRERLSCTQTIALSTAAGTGIGIMTGALLYLPVMLTRGDRAAVGTFKTVAIGIGVIGLIGGAHEPACQKSAA